MVELVVIVVIGWEAHQTDTTSFSANTNKDHEWDREELRELKEKHLAETGALLSALSNSQRTCYSSLSTPVFFTKEGQYKHMQSIINLTNLVLHCYGLDQDSVPVVYPSRNLFGQDCITNFQHNLVHETTVYTIQNLGSPNKYRYIMTMNQDEWCWALFTVCWKLPKSILLCILGECCPHFVCLHHWYPWPCVYPFPKRFMYGLDDSWVLSVCLQYAMLRLIVLA